MMDIDEIQNELGVALADFAAGDAGIMAALRAHTEQAEAELQEYKRLYGIAFEEAKNQAGRAEQAKAMLDDALVAVGLARQRMHKAEAEVAAIRAQVRQLREALEALKHADGCYCEAAFAMPGQAVRHSTECERAQAALAATEEPGQ